jgi:hypothetical protein
VKAAKRIAQYGRLRTGPLWRLLAANHGLAVIALLQTHLYGLDEGMSASPAISTS